MNYSVMQRVFIAETYITKNSCNCIAANVDFPAFQFLRNMGYIVVCFLLGNYPKESIQHTKHGESLKSRKGHMSNWCNTSTYSLLIYK